MKAKKIFIIIVFFYQSPCFSQLLFEQGVVKGGVTAAGFSSGLGFGSGEIHLDIPIGSNIKKVYAFTYKVGFPPPISFVLNGNNVTFDSNFHIMDVEHINSFASPLKLLYKDITNTITSLGQVNYVTIPLQLGLPINWGYKTLFLYVIFENPTLPVVNYCMLINDKKLIGNEIYSSTNMNPISTSYPVGFSLYTDICAIGESIDPITKVFFNSNLLGEIGGNDNTSSNFLHSGVKGHFSYYNNQLIGIDDDTPDFYMDSTDALADVSLYLIDNSTSINFKLKNINFPLNDTENKLAYFITYTSPCNSFPVTTSPDTSVCKGSTLQLQASGGVQYEWLPFAGLSCSNCPNPIVQTDSSQFYTVRIWNNDSCSVVRPVHVTVYQPAKFSGISISPATCGEANGQLTATLSNTAYLPLSFSVNNAPFQNSSTYTKQFQNLPYGPLLLTAKDGHQCTIDTLLTIPYNNTCSALFTASPSTGATPLNVQFSNQSTNATNYAWEINATSLGSILNNHIFDTAGTYFVQLYAWQNIPECIDSFSVQIIVFDSLVVQVPNVFTVNNDGVNDVFSLSSNQQITVAYSIVNRWGTVVASGTSKSLPITNGVYTTTIWDGRNATNGVYFYTITLQSQGENKIVNGFVERLD